LAGPATRASNAVSAKALGIAASVLGVLAVGAFGGWLVFGEHGDETKVVPPGEYLYLDNERVDAYLGQIEGGLSPTEERTRTTTRKAETSLKAADVASVGGSLQEDAFIKQVVTPSATDRFVSLDRNLRAKYDDTIHDLTPTGDFDDLMEGAGAVKEGDFVSIHDARLHLPSYVLPLPKAAYAARLVTEGQDLVDRRDVAHLLSTRREEVKLYLRRLGTDPRLPAMVFARELGDEQRTFSFLVPLRYSKLSDSPALMSGNVTIVGKVIRRVFDEPRGNSESFRDRSYNDIETATGYLPALKKASNDFLEQLSLEGPGLNARKVVNASATVSAPGLIVVPVAIFY
jgi:hypothetical protein